MSARGREPSACAYVRVHVRVSEFLLSVLQCYDGAGKDREPSQTNRSSSSSSAPFIATLWDGQKRLGGTGFTLVFFPLTGDQQSADASISTSFRTVTHSLTHSVTPTFLSLLRQNTQRCTLAPSGALCVTSCCTRIPPHFNALLCLRLMSVHHALVSAHTYSPLRMYSVQFRTYRHRRVHYMHECINSMFSLLWWACR